MVCPYNEAGASIASVNATRVTPLIPNPRSLIPGVVFMLFSNGEP
jgi:hypothetical protein